MKFEKKPAWMLMKKWRRTIEGNWMHRADNRSNKDEKADNQKYSIETDEVRHATSLKSHSVLFCSIYFENRNVLKKSSPNAIWNHFYWTIVYSTLLTYFLVSTFFFHNSHMCLFVLWFFLSSVLLVVVILVRLLARSSVLIAWQSNFLVVAKTKPLQ